MDMDVKWTERLWANPSPYRLLIGAGTDLTTTIHHRHHPASHQSINNPHLTTTPHHHTIVSRMFTYGSIRVVWLQRLTRLVTVRRIALLEISCFWYLLKHQYKDIEPWTSISAYNIYNYKLTHAAYTVLPKQLDISIATGRIAVILRNVDLARAINILQNISRLNASIYPEVITFFFSSYFSMKV